MNQSRSIANLTIILTLCATIVITSCQQQQPTNSAGIPIPHNYDPNSREVINDIKRSMDQSNKEMRQIDAYLNTIEDMLKSIKQSMTADGIYSTTTVGSSTNGNNKNVNNRRKALYRNGVKPRVN